MPAFGLPTGWPAFGLPTGWPSNGMPNDGGDRRNALVYPKNRLGASTAEWISSPPFLWAPIFNLDSSWTIRGGFSSDGLFDGYPGIVVFSVPAHGPPLSLNEQEMLSRT